MEVFDLLVYPVWSNGEGYSRYGKNVEEWVGKLVEGCTHQSREESAAEDQMWLSSFPKRCGRPWLGRHESVAFNLAMEDDVVMEEQERLWDEVDPTSEADARTE